MDRDTDYAFPRSTWRLLLSGHADGATNMATDEALLQSVAAGKSRPILRFYGWSPPCVSIGYAQSMRGEIDLDACRRLGYMWVRRPTGGRAVLHIDELTYSVIAPADEPRVQGDVVTSYRRLSRGLVAGLRRLGCDVVQANLVEASPEPKSAACFDVPSHYEVTALGRKLVGSAQVRRRGVVLQHGALPLCGDVGRLANVLALSDSERAQVRSKLLGRAVALDEALGRRVPFEKVVTALKEGFSAMLHLDFEPSELTEDERKAIHALVERYAGSEWTYSR